ncbi:hypothetical protein GGI20_001295 [Coemansia sp. BCRC 34301]|nr:hypothetical protein GGI20_001295 [Coemansia sp. BCRC 34301]
MSPATAIFRKLFDFASATPTCEPLPNQTPDRQSVVDNHGYGERLEAIRCNEYPQLYDASSQLRTVFLDHAGSTLYAASHIRAQTEEMLATIPANPHSQHAQSQWTRDKIEQARDRLLAFFGTTSRDYALVFTANATAAIRLVGELTPMSSDGMLCYTSAAHTSIVGLRGIAAEVGATVRPVEFDELDCIIRPENTSGTSLVAYPAQCNFSGEQFPWDVADKVARRFPVQVDDSSSKGCGEHPPWWVLVDAAAYASSSPLELGALRTDPDFVAVSMYKIFGAPTGVGALLVRRSSIPFLRPKRFFGGGTVNTLSFDCMWQEFRAEIEARLEDGTVNFQAIASLHHALDAHARNFGSMAQVRQHTSSITQYAVTTLSSLWHDNGSLLCTIYGHSGAGFGPTVALNLRDMNGSYIGYIEVERLAVMSGIAVRTGRFCNPGAARRWLDLTTPDLIRYASLGYTCGDDNDVISGKPVGAMRISFGAMTSRQDIDKFAAFLVRHFRNYSCSSAKTGAHILVPEPTSTVKSASSDRTPLPPLFAQFQVEVDQVVVYPVKSCHGWCVPRDLAWEVTRSGLKYDRSFVVMRENSSVPMQQKRYPRMALIRPRISGKQLVLDAPDHEALAVSLDPAMLHLEATRSTVCGSRVQTYRVLSSEVSSWLSSVLAVECYLACDPRLLLQSAAADDDDGSLLASSPRSSLSDSATLTKHKSSRPTACATKRADMSFANESQILLVTRESAQQVADWIADDEDEKQGSGDATPLASGSNVLGPLQYRPNIVVMSTRQKSCRFARNIQPFEELKWSSVAIGNAQLQASGPCRRCQMIAIDQESAKSLKEPYSTLARRMRVGGKVVFGIYLDVTDGASGVRNDSDSVSFIQSGMLIDVST